VFHRYVTNAAMEGEAMNDQFESEPAPRLAAPSHRFRGTGRCGRSPRATRPARPNRFSRAEMAPDALVQSVSSEVLEKIRNDPALHKGDVERLQKLIDDKVAPYVTSSA